MSPRAPVSHAVGAALLAAVVAACGGTEEAQPPGELVPVAPPAPPALAAPPAPTAPVAQDAGVDVAVPATCQGKLAAKGIQFAPTTARGVVDAVIVKSAIAGVRFTRDSSDDLTSDPMACEFVLTLERFATILAKHDVVRVGTLGSYCYRCCCAWSPTNECRSVNDPEPDCGGNGYSNHSWGRAVDVRYLELKDGTTLDINDPAQWVESSSAGTCTTALAKQKGKSNFLYSLVCETVSAVVFKTILTPNYNSAHRNHWHMDTGDKGTVGASAVRSLNATLIDVGAHGDVCGGE